MLKNSKTSTYFFLSEMDKDGYYPPQLVAKGKSILHDLCLRIEAQHPDTSEQFTGLTHAATERFNQLGSELEEEGSEIETVARENIAKDIKFIVEAYGFLGDVESLIENREW